MKGSGKFFVTVGAYGFILLFSSFPPSTS